MTEKDMEDALEIRAALDELAVQLACDAITEEQLRQLKLAMKNFEDSTRTGDVKKIAQADVRFHDAIYTATGNEKLVSILNNLREQVYRYRVEYLKDDKGYPTLIAEHEELYDGIARRDKEYVSQVMKRHVENQAEAVKNIIRKQEI